MTEERWDKPWIPWRIFPDCENCKHWEWTYWEIREDRMDRDSSEAISREAERRPRSQRMIEEFIKMVEEFAKWRELKVGLS